MGQFVHLSACAVAAGLAMGLASAASGSVTLQTQQRSITAATTSNANIQTVNAPGFAPFVESLSVSNVFQGPAGPVNNLAASRIDCQVDPNAIRATGTLRGAGGLSVALGAVETGDAKAAILVTFLVTTPEPFNLFAAARPNLHPTDEFVLELKNLTTNNRLFSLEQSDPPEAVNLNGVLPPGQYSLKYRIELSVDGDDTSRDFAFNLALGCPADFNGIDGVTVQDVFDYLAAYFASEARADLNHSGDVTVQDLLDFLLAYFTPCS